jgi:pimeloyl-ACP methyl ester carboxylesterase
MADVIENKLLALPDGRALGYCEYGDPQGVSIIYCHGFPGSRLEAAITQPVARRLGLRIISADRPGFGLSDPQPGRTLLDWPKDVAVLAESLGLERFAMLGVSGGGPYALACAHALAGRLTAMTIVCGLAPLTAPGILTHANWLARTSFVLARRAPRALKLFHTFITLGIMRAHPRRVLRWMAGLSVADRKLVEREEFLDAMAASIRESLRQDAGGVTAEFPLYARDWGFSLNEIQLPVQLWQGDADTTVPIGHARYLADALPNARLTVVPGEGHFSLPVDHMVEILTPFGVKGVGDK